MKDRLDRSFYLQQDVVNVARQLLGKVIVTRLKGGTTAGIITETEAYAGPEDRASHAFGGRRTARNEVMYKRGGTAYVYLCYGIHHLFNVVTHQADIPHAVLLRGIHPLEGMDIMRKRRGGRERFTTNGPGTAAQALGITTAYSGTDLLGKTIFIEDRGIVVPDAAISVSARIGVDYAGADALLPYRFNLDLRRLDQR